jgi:predicted nucleotidyltransferase
VTAKFEELIPALANGGVEFIMIGGFAGIVHGSARVTYDVDLVYSRADENIKRLAEALALHSPYLRDAPPGLAFSFDAPTIRRGLNFTLTTSLGDIDLFGEVPAGTTYFDLLPNSFDVEAFGVSFKCVDLPTLIRIKEAAGRPKDSEGVAELRVLLQERK